MDPLTPPGTYAAEVSYGDVTMDAVIEVLEEVALSFRPTSVVVDGTVGVPQTKTVLATNDGNVALSISDLGPVELEIDGPRSSLLDRLLGRDRATGSTTTDDEDDEDGDDEPDDPPTITGTLTPPVVVQPGETLPLAWSIVVGGTLRAGARYRVDAPVYTTDLEVVVVPHQRAPVVEPPPATARAVRAPTAARAKRARAQKAAAAPKRPTAAKKRAGTAKRAAPARQGRASGTRRKGS